MPFCYAALARRWQDLILAEVGLRVYGRDQRALTQGVSERGFPCFHLRQQIIAIAVSCRSRLIWVRLSPICYNSRIRSYSIP